MLRDRRADRKPRSTTIGVSARGVGPGVGEGGRLEGRKREGLQIVLIIAIQGYQETRRGRAKGFEGFLFFSTFSMVELRTGPDSQHCNPIIPFVGGEAVYAWKQRADS